MTKVNDYDKYASLRQQELKKGGKFNHRFIEKPAMRKLLPKLNNKSVLMLGCGTGEESLLLEEFGAKQMTGIDISKESIRLASISYPRHNFIVGDMHDVQLPDETFDFVYSSFTIHYSADPLSVYKEVFRLLKPGGTFQISVCHPLRWASERIEIDGVTAKILGYTETKEINSRRYGDYLDFAQYQETFSSGEVMSFWIGPPSMHFGLLKQLGFDINEFVEPKAVEEAKEAATYFYERFSHFPQFAIFVAQKPVE